MIKIDVTEAVKELRRRYADIDGEIDQQIAAALNDTARKARTAVSKMCAPCTTSRRRI
jgi:hypothetical protein